MTAERLVQPTSAVRNLIQPDRRPGAAAPDSHARSNSSRSCPASRAISGRMRASATRVTSISPSTARARSAVNWLLDGASNVNAFNNYTLVTTPSLDAIQEINVITSSYQAEWARNGGGRGERGDQSPARTGSPEARTSSCATIELNANSFFRNMVAEWRRSTAHHRGCGTTTSVLLWVDRRFQPARTCFSSFSGDWRRSTRAKGTAGIDSAGSQLADRSRRVQTMSRLKRAIPTR